METIKIGRWVVRTDVNKTMKAHSALTMSSAEECPCGYGRNFLAYRAQLMRGPLGVVLTQLGISPPWEVDVYSLGRVTNGLLKYGGWYHFVGTIESGTPAWKPIAGHESGWAADFEPLSSTVSIGVHTKVDLIRPSFHGLPLLQLEIDATIPWILNESEDAGSPTV